MEKVTLEEVTKSAAEAGYTSAMVDAITVVRRELGATAQALRIAEELQRLANKEKK